MGYKTQTDCCMLVIRSIYSTGDGVRCFKNVISPSCDSLDSHGSEWSLRCIGFLIDSSDRRDVSVSSTALSITLTETEIILMLMTHYTLSPKRL